MIPDPLLICRHPVECSCCITGMGGELHREWANS